jgi:hypothetical protein
MQASKAKAERMKKQEESTSVPSTLETYENQIDSSVHFYCHHEGETEERRGLW